MRRGEGHRAASPYGCSDRRLEGWPGANNPPRGYPSARFWQRTILTARFIPLSSSPSGLSCHRVGSLRFRSGEEILAEFAELVELRAVLVELSEVFPIAGRKLAGFVRIAFQKEN